MEPFQHSGFTPAIRTVASGSATWPNNLPGSNIGNLDMRNIGDMNSNESNQKIRRPSLEDAYALDLRRKAQEAYARCRSDDFLSKLEKVSEAFYPSASTPPTFDRPFKPERVQSTDSSPAKFDYIADDHQSRLKYFGEDREYKQIRAGIEQVKLNSINKTSRQTYDTRHTGTVENKNSGSGNSDVGEKPTKLKSRSEIRRMERRAMERGDLHTFARIRRLE
ncbi:hypothetical protein B0J14DRAFT_566145 [Halenospora varia]|nr:hypothetical protein B0J14DRAFT_566145 [Halenospora varia]